MNPSTPTPLVAVIMGSKSDWETMKNASETLARFGVPHDSRVTLRPPYPRKPPPNSRPPPAPAAFESSDRRSRRRAHLAGVLAAHTLLPVLGVPMESQMLRGMDSLLSTVQMPAGIPVGTLATRQGLERSMPNSPRAIAIILALQRPDLEEETRRLPQRTGRDDSQPNTSRSWPPSMPYSQRGNCWRSYPQFVLR